MRVLASRRFGASLARSRGDRWTPRRFDAFPPDGRTPPLLTTSSAVITQVVHLCLIEVWHLKDTNVVRQAEGPRPRTIPSAEAWYWIEQWCESQGVDLSTWDCYS